MTMFFGCLRYAIVVIRMRLANVVADLNFHSCFPPLSDHAMSSGTWMCLLSSKAKTEGSFRCSIGRST